MSTPIRDLARSPEIGWPGRKNELEESLSEYEQDGISHPVPTEGLKEAGATAEADEDVHSEVSEQGLRQAEVHSCHICANIPDEAVNLVKQNSGLDAEAARKAAFVLIQFMKENRHTEGVQNLLKYISDLAFHGSSVNKRIDSYYAKMVSTPVQVRDQSPEIGWPGRKNELEESLSEYEQDGISHPVPTEGLKEAGATAEADEDVHSEVSEQGLRQAEVHSCHICANIPDEAVNLVKQNSGLDAEAARKAAFVLIQFMKEKRHTEGVQNMLKYISDLAFHCSSANERVDSYYAKVVSTPVSPVHLHAQRPEIGWPCRKNGLEKSLSEDEQDGTCPPFPTEGSKEADVTAETEENGQSRKSLRQVEMHSCHICANIPDEAVSLVKQNSGLDAEAARKAAFVLIQFMKENRHTEGVQNLLKYISDLAFHGSSVNKRIDSYYAKMVSTPVQVRDQRPEIGWPGRKNGLKESLSEDEQDGIYPPLPTKDFEETFIVAETGEDVTGHYRAQHVAEHSRFQHVAEQSRFQHVAEHSRAQHVAEHPRAQHVAEHSRDQHVAEHSRAQHVAEHSRAQYVAEHSRAQHVAQQILKDEEDYDDEFEVSCKDTAGPLKSQLIASLKMNVDFPLTSRNYMQAEPVIIMRTKVKQRSSQPEDEINVSELYRTSHDGLRLTLNATSRLRSDRHREGRDDRSRQDSRNIKQTETLSYSMNQHYQQLRNKKMQRSYSDRQ